MYQKTVTLFNRSGDKWYPTVLHNVDLNVDRAAIVGRYGSDSTDRATIHVRCVRTSEGVIVEGKVWKPPIEWRSQTSVSGTLTFTDGSELFDFFCEGEYTPPTPSENTQNRAANDGSISDDDYGLDGFYNYMNRTRDGVFAISSVSGPFTVIPHFEIVGR